jgi:UDP-3-O-[3-hydroxymyristoyl] glucosamine N-acyltransferase
VIGDGSTIGAGCVIGEGVRIGENCRLYSRVTLEHDVVLGNRCIVHSGAVIGADGFGLVEDGEHWIKVPQLGSVSIGDDVEIGANTTIDRGAMDDTVIEQGCKLDNQIQVAHNVRIGAHTAIAACVGIAGSAEIGRYCKISGAAVILGHLRIADGVTVTAMSLVTRNIREAGVYSSGTPLMENSLWHRSNARYKMLEALAQRIAALEKSRN